MQGFVLALLLARRTYCCWRDDSNEFTVISFGYITDREREWIFCARSRVEIVHTVRFDGRLKVRSRSFESTSRPSNQECGVNVAFRANTIDSEKK